MAVIYAAALRTTRMTSVATAIDVSAAGKLKIGTTAMGTILATLTLTLLNEAGAVVNSVANINILNTGRGVVDASGNLTVTLGPADTVVSTGPAGAQRTIALILNWVSGGMTGRHQANLTLVALAG